MYIAHECPECGHDVVNNFDHETLTCESCEYKEDNDTFWKIYRQEDYLRWLEFEIEKTYPFRDISIIHSGVTLAVGNHVLGRFEGRDSNMQSAIDNHKKLVEEFQMCCLGLDNTLEKIKKSYRNIAERHDDEHTRKHQCNIDTLDEAFKDLIQQLKDVVA